MSIEKMQDEFEAWVLSEYENQHMGKFATGEYHSTTVQFCWLAWQASRAALVVELPDACAYEGLTQELGSHVELSYERPEHDPVGLIRLADTRAAIEAAGVKVKP